MTVNYAAADRPRPLPAEIRGVAWTRTRRTKVTTLTASNVAALREADNDDEGSLEWRAGVHEWADGRRREAGLDDLDTEPELHRRARALGLLRTLS